MPTLLARRALAAERMRRRALRDSLMLSARTRWAAMGSWKDQDVDRFVELLLPQVLGARAAAASGMNSALTIAAGAESPLIGVTDIRGVSDQLVYRRPAVELYTALSRGVPFTKALAFSVTRLNSIISTDVQMSATRQSLVSMQASSSPGYMRVPSGDNTCVLCEIASTQRYRSGDLMPIHPGCGCGVDPLPPGTPLGQVIDQARLDSVYEQLRDSSLVQGTGSKEDWLNLVAVQDHGEIGPVLTWRSQQFTGPADI